MTIKQRVERAKKHQENKYNSLKYFTRYVFSIGIEESGLTGIDKDGNRRELKWGPFVDNICDFLQNNQWTLRVSARDHFKSTSFYAHFCWILFRSKKNPTNLDNYYLSYKANLSAEHIAYIKKIIRAIPDFNNLTDLKPNAEGVIAYTWDGKHVVTMEPMGMLEFKRGLHMKGVLYGDDLLRDPTNKLDPLVIRKINETFKKEIIPMPHGQFHVVGTAQTNQDFFFDDSLVIGDDELFTEDNKLFRRKIEPAIVSQQEKKVLFPEFRSWDWLQNKKKLLGDKIFDQEYQVKPAYDTDAYFEENQIRIIVNEKLENVSTESERPTEHDILAGYDIGKKAHPSHVSVFEVIETDKRHFKQIYQKYFDNVDYIRQIEVLTNLVKKLRIDILYYDATRGELDALDEQGKLPAEFEPVKFTLKRKNAMATVLYKKVIDREIELINDERQIRHILSVDNSLDAVEIKTGPYKGHGDSFWSNALALSGEISIEPTIE